MKGLLAILVLLIMCQRVGYSQAEYARCGVLLVSTDKATLRPVFKSTSKTIQIRVVFHVVQGPDDVYISDNQIQQQLDRLNEDFNSTNADLDQVPAEFRHLIPAEGIYFHLATRQLPDQQFDIGIYRMKTDKKAIGLTPDVYLSERGGSTAWPAEEYLNIWIADLGSKITGLGSGPQSVDPYMDGVLVDPSFFSLNDSKRYSLGRVLVHEIGHYLGLNHPWEDQTNCQRLPSSIADIPLQSTVYDGCPTHPQLSCESNDLFMSYMNYVDDDCMVMFSRLQMDYMRSIIVSLRPGLMVEPSLVPTSEEVEIFPNPVVKGSVTLKLPSATPKLTRIVLYDYSGRLCFDQSLFIAGSYVLLVDHLPAGLYILKVDRLAKRLVIS